MSEFFRNLLDTSDFPPRWYCGNWTDGLGWLHIVSDVVIAASYFAIPLVLTLFVRKRKDVPFTPVFWLFSAFIIACGVTHLIEATLFWYPVYRVSGLAKLATAIVSATAVVAAVRIMPQAMRLPSLAATNDRLMIEIEQRKRAESELLETRQHALAASQAKSEFLANMSHEIRTPMAAILGYADVLLTHLADPDNRNCVMIMKRNGNFLLDLINDILDLSRIEAGKMDLNIEPVNIPSLVSDLRSLMEVRAVEKRLTLNTYFANPIPEIVCTDAIRLRQVLINLLGNAIKFTEQGSVALSVSYHTDDQAPRLDFAVIDDGIGISPDQLSRLFKPFSQGDSSVTRSFGGSGLGLAISKRLAEMLQGKLTVKSELGKGSTFRLSLPVQGFEASHEPTASTPQEVRFVQPSINQVNVIEASIEKLDVRLDCRVLVVDDRRDVRHISQHFLEKAGADVVTAEDGEEAIARAVAASDKRQPFHVVVMDMQMPKLDGLQTVQLLRARGFEVPIIALTADAMQGDRERCLNGGCDDYLAKPIDHNALVEMVFKYSQGCDPDELKRLRSSRREGVQGLSS